MTETPPSQPVGLDERANRVRQAIKAWKTQLIDLGGQNRLLYYRDLKLGTLDLSPRDGDIESDAVARLLAGIPIRLAQIFQGAEVLAANARRARAIQAKALENFEERGIETLHIAWGLATWTNTRTAAVPAAPVLLFPLELSPRGASREDFELTIRGDLVLNPALVHLLAVEHEIRFDPDALLEEALPDESGAPQASSVFSRLKKEADSLAGFEISDRIVVGNFSYAKLPMVRDLDTYESALVAHDLVAALAGDPAAREAIRDRQADVSPAAPDVAQPQDEYLILDADASQNHAINSALAGEHLIIQGPPGTGKSQTIANLISAFVARGQRVLFVAEKRAAIDAVLKRLEHVGLVDLVMDLHGGTKSRREVAQQLQSALRDVGRTPQPDLLDLHRSLAHRKSELNVHVEAMHRKRDPWGLAFIEVLTELLALPTTAASPVRLSDPCLSLLDAVTIGEARRSIAEFVELGALELTPAASPWAGANITKASEAQEALQLARRAQVALQSVTLALAVFCQETGLRDAETIAGWEATFELVDKTHQLLQLFNESVFSIDSASLSNALEPATKGSAPQAWARATSSAYRKARKTVLSLRRDASREMDDRELFNSVTWAHQIRDRWAGLASVPGSPRGSQTYQAAHEALWTFQEQFRALGAFLDADAERISIKDAGPLLERLITDDVVLFKLPRLFELKRDLTTWGLYPLMSHFGASEPSPEAFVNALDYTWLSSIREHVSAIDPTVGAFDGKVHQRRVSEFRSLDRDHIESTPRRVRRVVAERAVAARDQHASQGQLVAAQAKKKRGHLPLRKVFADASDVLLALKPCWAMSPLLVSQLLPADSQYFDVAIFDEASQVLPADAIPTILRAKQVIVAGDDKQLPPTTFFAGHTQEDFEDEDVDDGSGLVSGFESILDVLGALLRPFMLTWHYRSTDERLIAFSNVYLYDRSLTTFPGVLGPKVLEKVLVPFEPGLPDQETSSSPEVLRAVELILSHAEEHPDDSLGVIAMGIKHANRIEEALRRALNERHDLSEFFREDLEERFFVKNLERVQGDERDAIILSIGYGKNSDGRLLYRFGPLLTQGGERRLNVAVTRARRKMTLLSSFDDVDMDPGRSKARGVDLLRLYFPYVASGGANLGDLASGTPELNPFEIDVRNRLVAAGIPLVPQYGCSGYRIDFAATHPKEKGRFVLAIESDGAGYHSSQTARDRDRLRQDVLERLGWRFHRIWSTDWFRNPDRETERVLAAWEQAVRDADAEPTLPQTVEEPDDEHGDAVERIKAGVESGRDRGPKPITGWGESIDYFSPKEIDSLIRWIESDTLLRTRDELIDEAIIELGFKRRGKNIVTAIEAAIARTRRKPG